MLLIIITNIHALSLRIILGRWPKIYIDDPKIPLLISWIKCALAC